MNGRSHAFCPLAGVALRCVVIEVNDRLETCLVFIKRLPGGAGGPE